ncbi:esterase [Oceanobacillus iheyensis HTE831]|uniref:Esterase n=1 Tax=Oceanobacillus iheyensis (strain DSM 14371 / CIP 107618 / JCM 11309 / KCTC 3954 / HTE831) TaxID=221109 RepID=Q8ETG1_OCEIH|nr:alpha/beta fold hydrolase [Oceanobacillus iheyensis]BAC12256.1 esterase [Oceanobacillus iheyensis HTE831]
MAEQYTVLEGAESFHFEGNRVGVLVSHGFTGTTQSMRPLGKAFADAGYTVCGPRLKGHGTHYEDMEKTTFHDWIQSIEEGYQWLQKRCDTIYMCGLSMGGTLSLYMAEKYSGLKGIVLINAAIEVPDMETATTMKDTRFIDAIGSDIKKPNVQELAYEKTPVQSIREIVGLMEQVRLDLNKVTCPTFIFVSNEDHVVPPYNSEVIYKEIQSEVKEIISLKESYHVATLDNDQAYIIEKALEFISKH